MPALPKIRCDRVRTNDKQSDMMRPNQQNKNRSRGRNNGRKHSNPLSRNYESNGPDVKIRGNAAHIAEKYVQLARDAQASGDSVTAENYFQHAEHYFRIVSASQGQAPQRQDQVNDDGNEGDEEATARQSPPPAPSGEANKPAVAADAEPAKDAEPAAASEGEAEPKRPRRPRRRKYADASDGDTNAGSAGSENPAGAPQPDVGELPAFLTGSAPARAAE